MLARTYRPRLYRTSRWVLLALFKLFHRLRVQGSHHVPQTGGCLLASNHASFMDPPALSCAIKHRVVRFMARDTLFKEGLRSWFMHGVAAFPISRERGDVGALKKCIQLLKGGDCVGIFPEGTRTRDGELGPVKPGIGFLIMAAGVPVVPAYIDGTFAAFPRGASRPKLAPIRIHFGPPIQPEELEVFGKGRDSYEKVAHLVMERIRALKPTST
jgi:1-acyl-sn-glycerol-3-phosphate acyltransferase